MLKLELIFDGTNYDSIITTAFPIFLKNNLLCKVAIHTATSKLKNTDDTEKDIFISSLLNNNKKVILEKINEEAKKLGADLSLTDLSADAT